MSSFSRVIAPPVHSMRDDGSPHAAEGKLVALRDIWESLPNVVVYGPGSYQRYLSYRSPTQKLNSNAYGSTDNTHVSLPDRESDPVVSTMPIPQRRDHFARTESMGSMPSLCSDDIAMESPLSCSPPLSSPESPPPTGCSAVAVLGSPGYMGGFGDEHDQPGSNPDFIRMQLQWRQHFARMAEDVYASTDDKSDNGAPAAPAPPVKVTPAKAVASQGHTASRVLSTRPRVKTSRLSLRVQTPPPLNTNALKAETLLSKLLRGSYDVEVGHTDGSAISEAESGFEGDDEGEDDAAGKGAVNERSGDGCALGDAVGGRKQLQSTKKTYAAIAAAAARGDVVPGASVVSDGGMQSTKDWTSMFERQGPLVEVVDV